MIKTVGFIGSGDVTRALAPHLLRAGVSVLISNSRGPSSLGDLIVALGDGAQAVTVEAVARADLVILAMPFVRVPELGERIPDWTGRVVVDATNQFAHYEPAYSGYVDLGDDTGSEWVERNLPGSTVIKAFNAMYATYIASEPRHQAGRQVVFYAGDDAAANADFDGLLATLGFAPVAIGGLREGGRLMQLGGPLSALHVLRR
jgi:8-hydroxy-5-deazaflavin:NADPH oxidoreductase